VIPLAYEGQFEGCIMSDTVSL